MEYSVQFPYGQHVLDPMFDVGFKLIFGREDVSEPLLIDLLNSIFDGDPKFGNIVSLSFKNTEHPNEWVEGKGIRYDIKCETADHHHFIVEMQKAEQEHFLERCCYYVDRAVAAQGYRGKGKEKDGEEWDFSLEPVVGVFFCNFHVRELDCRPVVKARLADEETHQPVGDCERYVFIQIPYFKHEEDECTTKLEKWIYNIKNMGRMQKVAFTIEDTFRYLNEVSDFATLPQSEREIYEAELMKARDYYATMKTARKRGMEKGLEEGREIGLEQGRVLGLEQGRVLGLEQGRALGLEEGRMEGRAEGRLDTYRQVVKNLAQMGMTPEDIAKATGLSMDELSALN
ncbi:MAG: Rpn family recombination-promoting nuclease/putative transposase [Muribaculaceae bacterium]|nr:Rpn family recombination-promoting nuclease/putative transposase [Muribaculaceae bacterium]